MQENLTDAGRPDQPACQPPHHQMPFVRIELVVMTIGNKGLIVLQGQREVMPFAGQWALPGGVLRIDLDCDLDDAAQRVATERLGVRLPNLRQLRAVGGVMRDPRAPWALSILYRALVVPEAVAVSAGKRLTHLRWCAVEAAANDESLAFDHARLIRQAAEETRAEIETLTFPEGSLPAQFTLSELQAICEKVLGRHLDKASFRQRLEHRNRVEPIVGSKRKGAYRPAQLYRLR